MKKSYRICYVGLISAEVIYADDIKSALCRADKDLEVESISLR